MVLTFRSTIPEKFTLTGTDRNGRQRVATATKNSGDFYWKMELRHPSGESWQGRYHGEAGVLDALTEMLASRDADFVRDAARGDRPREGLADPNRNINDAVAPITAQPSMRR